MDSRQAVLDSIRLIVRAVRVSSASTERRLGISVAQLFVLQQLQGRDGLSINDLARATLTHQSSVSVVVGRLVSSRLVRRSLAAGDRRKASLALTPKGRALLARAPEPVQAGLVRALDGLTAAERRTLAALLGKWTRSAGIDAALPPLFGEERKRPA